MKTLNFYLLIPVLSMLFLFINNCKKEESNDPPTIKINTPVNNYQIKRGNDLAIQIAASDPNNNLETVEIYIDQNFVKSFNSGNIQTTIDIDDYSYQKHTLKATVTDSKGLNASAQVIFSVLSNEIPTVNTYSAYSITASTAKIKGEVMSDNGSQVTSYGFCWNTSGNPTLFDTKKEIGSGAGTFETTISSLTPNTKYYYKAWATNENGTAFGEETVFETQMDGSLATVTFNINDATVNKTTCKITMPYHVTSDGGKTVTQSGICWSTTTTPTINSSKSQNAGGTGNFECQISTSEFVKGTKYYFRAYAVNSNGTAYSDTYYNTDPGAACTSAGNLPTVTFSIFDHTIDENCIRTFPYSVTSDGGSTVTASGICWSTTSPPTINDFKCTNSGGTGNLSCKINSNNFTKDTKYYFRAYATNAKGTAYSGVTGSHEHPGNCDASYKDPRTGYYYSYQQFGNLTWMTKDMYYQGYTVFYYSERNNVCPSGWHVPSRAEWDNLVTLAGGVDNAGYNLKNSDYGFNATRSGYWSGSSGAYVSTSDAFYLNSTGSVIKIANDQFKVSFSSQNSSNAYPVRCVKDVQ